VQSVPWHHVPCTYVHCDKDQGIYVPLQEKMLKAAMEDPLSKYPWKVVRLDSSHSLWLSQPSTVIKLIRETAGESV
jgi:hypothetical protein